MTHTIGVIPGDGTGPEVVREGLKVLEAVRAVEGFDVELVEFDLGGERYLRTGDTLPDDELARLREMDAILLGAVGHPDVKPGILERDLLLRARFELDQYVNLRPIIRYPGVQTLVPSHGEDDVNMVVVRENSEGLYSGAGGFHRKGTEHEVAVQESINTRHGVERIVRYAFELAMRPDRRRKLTLVHKTNVLTFAGDLYQRVVNEVAAEFPDVDDRLRPCRRVLHLLPGSTRPFRCDRDGQHVRRHHHGPRRHDPGRHGHRRGRQHQPGRRQHVRADRRHGARSRRARPRSTRSPRSVPSRCCSRSWVRTARRRASRRASGSRARRWSRCAPARWAIPTSGVGDLVVERATA